MRVAWPRTTEQAHLRNVLHNNRQHSQEGWHCTIVQASKHHIAPARVIDAHEATNMSQPNPSGALLQVQDKLQEVPALVSVIHLLSTLLDIK